jgi:immune inhibitor A
MIVAMSQASPPRRFGPNRSRLLQRHHRAVGLVGLLILIGIAGCGSIISVPPSPPTQPPVVVPTATPTPADILRTLPTAPPLVVEDLHRRVNPPQPAPPSSTPGQSRDDPLGTDITFQVGSLPRPARIVGKTDHAYWYVEDGLVLAPAKLQVAMDFFEQQSYPTTHQLFNWDIPLSIDNDRRVTIFIGHLPGSSPGGFGFGDLNRRWFFPNSNERKMIYVNVDVASPGTRQFNAVVAGALALAAWETSHPAQDWWVKQGTQLLAVDLAVGTTDDLLDPNGIGLFGVDSQVQLNAFRPGQADRSAANTSAYLFARYVAERFGGSSPFTHVFAAPGHGIAAYDAVFRSDPQPTTFADVFGDWIAANVLNDPTLDSGHYGYRGNIKVNPKLQTGPTMSASVAGKASQFGATYFQVDPTTATTLTFTGDLTVRITGADPHDSNTEWWGNRGDEIDSRLTRSVDLRSVSTATLRFWTWFDIEKDFDYAYVEVSGDGGATWRTLRAPDTTRDNPNGGNLGDGFTGTSGGTIPRWVQETTDLTPYAGHEILLRFEYGTDTAATGDGFVVDGVEIPEIGLHDDGASDNGWTAEGFVRTDNSVSQPWLVEVITRDPTNPVRRIKVGADGTGSVGLDAGQPTIVAVTGLASETSMPAQFQLRLLHR